MSGKVTGLGMNCWVGGYNISNDIGSIARIGVSQALLPSTGIDVLAMERLAGERDGGFEFDSVAYNVDAGRAHAALSTLPRTDRVATVTLGTTAGSVAASCIGKQIGYDGSRDKSGNFKLKTVVESNGYGLDWGVLLTASPRTDTAATDGAGVDLTTVSTAFGLQAYLQVSAFTGTDVTVKIQDSANNSAFADVTSAAFTQITGSAPLAQRIAVTGTVRRYLRVSTVTTGGFSSLAFVVHVVRNPVAVSF